MIKKIIKRFCNQSINHNVIASEAKQSHKSTILRLLRRKLLAMTLITNAITCIKKFDLEFKKFFAAKSFGRKYIRTGQCKACGKCCQSIYVRHSSHIIGDIGEFERLIPQHFFYSYLKVIGKDETGLIFECTKLNKEKGICTAYRNRALICRQYPQEEVFMMGGIISEECGFSFIPIKSFDEVFKKVKSRNLEL